MTINIKSILEHSPGTSLVVQCLRLCAFTAGSADLITGQEIKTSHAIVAWPTLQPNQLKKKKTRKHPP